MLQRKKDGIQPYRNHTKTATKRLNKNQHHSQIHVPGVSGGKKKKKKTEIFRPPFRPKKIWAPFLTRQLWVNFHAYAACKVWIWEMVPFFNKQGIIKKNGFPLKPDDIIVMSSNAHEWKGKPRPITWYQCLMWQIIRNKVIPNDSNNFVSNDLLETKLFFPFFLIQQIIRNKVIPNVSWAI